MSEMRASRRQVNVSKPIHRTKLNKKLAAYSAMATGAVAATTGTTAHAVFSVTDITDVTITTTTGDLWFNIMDGTTSPATMPDNPGPATFRAVAAPFGNGIGAGLAEQAIVPASTSNPLGPPFAERFNSGDSVVPTLSFSSSTVGYAGLSFMGVFGGPWEPAPQEGFVGLRFEINGLIHLGWAQITNNQDRSLTLQAVAWDPEPINPPQPPTGGVPEPTTFGLGALALGAMGVAALKRRREAQAIA